MAQLQLNLTDETWIPSKQRFSAGAVPLDADGNAIHGLTAEWTTSDKQVVFVSKDGRASRRSSRHGAADRPGGKQRMSVKINVYDDGRTNRPATSILRRIQNAKSCWPRNRNAKLYSHIHRCRFLQTIGYLTAKPTLSTSLAMMWESRKAELKPRRKRPLRQTGPRKPRAVPTYTFGVPLVGIPGRQLDAASRLNLQQPGLA